MAEIGEHRALAETVLGGDQHGLLIALGDQQRNHRLPRLQAHAAHAAGAAAHRPHVFLVEPDRLAGVRHEHDVALSRGQLDTDQVVVIVEQDGDDAGLARIGEVGQRRLLDGAHQGRHEDILVVREFLDRQDGVDPLAFFQREEIDDRLAAAVAAALRRFVNLEPVAAAAVGEAQDVVMGVGDKQLIDEILVLDRRRQLAATAAALGAVIGQRLGLDVAAVRQRHHHVLRRDEILDAEFLGVQDDLRAALVAELVADGGQFGDDDFGDAFRTGQDVEQVGDPGHDVLVLGDDLVLFEAGQALQAELEDGLRLRVGEPVALSGKTELGGQSFRPRGVGRRALQHLLDHRAAPGPFHQAALGIGRRRRRLDQGDDLIDVGQRDSQTFENVAALARLAQLEDGAPRHHLAPVGEEAFEHLLQVEQARLAVDQRHHVHAEGILQLRLLVQVVEDDLADLAALQLDDDAHPRLVRLVADVGDALDLLLVDQLGDLLDQGLLVHLIGNLVDDQRLAVALADVLEVRAGAHDHAAAAGLVAFADAHDSVDQRGSRKIRGGDVFDQLVDAERRIRQQGETAGDHLVQVVRRDVGRHADRDAGRAVDQQVRNARRQNQRLVFGTIVVRSEIDGFLLEVFEQLVTDPRHAHFGVAHRRGVVAIDRAEVALAIDQHVAQREILRHANDRVIDRRIAVRVVFADHVADDARRLLVRLVPVVGEFVHGEKDPPMHRLEAVAHVGERPADDDAHRIIEVGTPHLVLEADRQCFFGEWIHVWRSAPPGQRFVG